MSGSRALSRIDTYEWHSVYPGLLGRDSIVLDLGAHRGAFSLAITQAFGCRCHAIEASPLLYRDLPVNDRITPHNYAIAAKDGPLTFHIHEKADSSSILDLPPDQCTQAVTVEGLRLETFLRRQGIDAVDLVKVDIEGAEIPMLDSLSDEALSRIAQLTIEFHDFCNLVPRSEVDRIVRRLRRLGFYYLPMTRQGQDTLFINRRLHRVPLWECLYIRYIVRNVRGIGRIIRRWLGLPIE